MFQDVLKPLPLIQILRKLIFWKKIFPNVMKGRKDLYLCLLDKEIELCFLIYFICFCFLFSTFYFFFFYIYIYIAVTYKFNLFLICLYISETK